MLFVYQGREVLIVACKYLDLNNFVDCRCQYTDNRVCIQWRNQKGTRFMIKPYDFCEKQNENFEPAAFGDSEQDAKE
jgi:hypothetical protein